MPFEKHDQGKLQPHLLPTQELIEVMWVFTKGASKYSADGWTEYDGPWSRYVDALDRHLLAWKLGETCDPQSTQNHLAHVIANALFLMWYQNNDKGQDDRWFTKEL